MIAAHHVSWKTRPMGRVFFWCVQYCDKISASHLYWIVMGFMFQNTSGLFFDPQIVSVISQHAESLLEKYIERSDVSEKNRLACENFLNVLKNLPIEKVWSETQSNDEESPKKNQWCESGSYAASYKFSRYMVGLSSSRSRFDPSEGENFSPKPSTWKWEPMASLIPYCSSLKAVAKELDITIDTKVIRLADRLFRDWEEQRLTVREETVDQDLAKSSAWIIYSKKSQKYIDAQWYSASLSSARIFPSKESALNALKKSRHKNDDFVPVEVNIQIASLDLEALGGGVDATPLMEAYSIVQREYIEKALMEADVEQLRARLAQLEGPSPSTGEKPKKRM